MRLVRFATVALLAGVFLGGCSSYYWATREQPQNPVFKPYQHLYIGWVALPEDLWQKAGSPSKDEWVKQIQSLNTTGLQQYVKDWIPGVQVSGAQAPEQGMPAEGDLYVKIGFQGLVEKYDRWSSTPDEMSLEVEFIDLATKETVYSASLVVTSKSTFGARDFKCFSFDGRVDNTMYNLAGWIKERLGR